MPDQGRSYRVTDAPLDVQPTMPSGVQDYVLSFDVSRLIMKIRHSQDGIPFEDWPTWYFKEAVGQAVVTDTDEVSGRINIRGLCSLQGDTLYFWREE